MARTTRATQALGKAQVAHSVHEYEYDPDAPSIGLQAADALGVAPDRVLKTLMTLVDGQPVCAVIGSGREVSMKRLAVAAGGKAAQMMKPADAERATGYHVGGISPLGQKRRPRAVVVDAAAMEQAAVFVNGGQRGLQIQLAPADLVRALDARVADISA